MNLATAPPFGSRVCSTLTRTPESRCCNTPKLSRVPKTVGAGREARRVGFCLAQFQDAERFTPFCYCETTDSLLGRSPRPFHPRLQPLEGMNSAAAAAEMKEHRLVLQVSAELLSSVKYVFLFFLLFNSDRNARYQHPWDSSTAAVVNLSPYCCPSDAAPRRLPALIASK